METIIYQIVYTRIWRSRILSTSNACINYLNLCFKNNSFNIERSSYIPLLCMVSEITKHMHVILKCLVVTWVSVAKCRIKNSQRTRKIINSTCGSLISPSFHCTMLPQLSSRGPAFLTQRSSCGSQDPTVSIPQEARRSCQLGDAKRSSCACIILGLYCITSSTCCLQSAPCLAELKRMQAKFAVLQY